ncbi:vitamin K epoxide reductase family protein [Mucilaginibacter ginsenosidivorax]|uniref:Peptidase C39 domain-containing protein n=1 Tax=Mucilaginibacter ginsenosidivorax TaxID=862126 RepID=A0A5B8W1P3_9SPHI|nr:vitamin K epoxide reductase family protein [Mucilaginibacter ginsenosidivorax]QEC77651.1 hypothetical protein FSB76_17520 [Mucilaginibacter ginsenosidivorax]
MLFINNYENADAVAIMLLKCLRINIPAHEIVAELSKHPDYPSLLAISDVLQNFNVNNAAYQVSIHDAGKVPCPFITNLNRGDGEFIVVDKLTDGEVFFYNDKGKQKLPRTTFDKFFGGVVLTAEKSSDLLEQQAKTKLSVASYRLPAIIAGILIILSGSLITHSTYLANVTWQIIFLTIVKTSGLATTVLLLIQGIDGNNPLVQKLCQSVGKSNCNAVLTSKAANVFAWLSWSEVGFLYFAGTWLLLLFGNGSALVWYTLLVLNLVSLPYTFYSIYYQARIAKQWCLLCCTVQAILWLEFITMALSNVTGVPVFTAAGLSNIVICLLVPTILWAIVKPYLLRLQLLSPLKKQLRTFKYNVELFNNMLKAQPRYAMPAEDWSIVLGNAEANNIITMVTNPYCQPCSKTHQVLDNWLNQNPNLQARIIFTANNNDSDIKTPVSRHLMALNKLTDKTIVKHALHDWYGQKQKSYDAWAKAYPVQLNETEFYKIDQQKAWCQMAEVTATPALLLNGYRLPNIYQLPDLKYMLE